jgi:Dolichyl-phosphate-mannose-protein mannosyltransferase
VRRRWAAGLVLAAGTALYATLAVTSMRVKSATFDEAAHLPAGYTYLALRDHRLNPEHPPLIKVLAAAPLLLMDVQLRPDDEAWRLRRQWEFGRRFLYRWNDADRLLFWGRVPIVALGVLLGAAVFFRARRDWGLPAAALALFLCALSPDVLAHGQIVTTDVGAALFIFLSVIAFERLLERATWARFLLAGLAVGAAIATKFSTLVLAPILAALGLVAVVSSEPMRRAWSRDTARDVDGRGRRVAHVALLLLGIAAVALVVLWASYGFASPLSPDPAVDAAFEWGRVSGQGGVVDAAMGAARRVHLLPEAYAFGFLRFFRHSEARPTFLLGRLSDRGFWYYFPVTFALKTPLALLPLLVLSLATRRHHPATPRTELFLWLPVVLYFLFACTLGLNIGHRHLLPIYPFLFVIAGRCATLAAVRFPGILSSVAVLVLAGWYGTSVARVHPHYLAYFNELAGGPADGYRYLVDSNLDWGQDLKGLSAWVDANGVSRIKLSYFGTADPEYYRIPCELLPGQMLPPPRDVVREVRPGDVVAVSATNLQGVYLRPEDRPLMERLRAQAPVATIGHSIRIYRADFAWPAP